MHWMPPPGIQQCISVLLFILSFQVSRGLRVWGPQRQQQQSHVPLIPLVLFADEQVTWRRQVTFRRENLFFLNKFQNRIWKMLRIFCEKWSLLLGFFFFFLTVSNSFFLFFYVSYNIKCNCFKWFVSFSISVHTVPFNSWTIPKTWWL